MPIRGWTLKSVNPYSDFRQSLPKIEEELEEGDDEENSESGEEPHAEEEDSRPEEEVSEEEEEEDADGGQNEENRCVLLLTEVTKTGAPVQLVLLLLDSSTICKLVPVILVRTGLRRYSVNFQGAQSQKLKSRCGARNRFQEPSLELSSQAK